MPVTPAIEAIVVRMPDGTEQRLTVAQARALLGELAALLQPQLGLQVLPPFPVLPQPWQPMQPTWIGTGTPPLRPPYEITCSADRRQ